ncbi:MAG: hypothetical protein RLZZ511_3596 [Cyanobacteriota bacterium]|jgi:hypothetical protein
MIGGVALAAPPFYCFSVGPNSEVEGKRLNEHPAKPVIIRKEFRKLVTNVSRKL